MVRALNSVLKQDYESFEIVIFDDCSTDGTQDLVYELKLRDDRIKYMKPKQNVGSKFGDREILRRFIYEISRGEYVIYLCDDDFWIPEDLLSRATRVLDQHPEVVQVAGAQVQIYSNPIDEVINTSQFWHYEVFDDLPNAVTMKNIFPHGLIDRNNFLKLQTENPVIRNILTGATLFRKSSLLTAGVLRSKFGSKWQAGYELTTGIATQGPSFYFDTPSIAAGVDINSASFRGTQLGHLKDCLKSVGIAFNKPKKIATSIERKSLGKFERQMKKNILLTYLKNKIGYELGYFGSPWLPEIEKIFRPPISVFQFCFLAAKHWVPLSKWNYMIILISVLPQQYMESINRHFCIKYGDNWLNERTK